VRKFIRIAIPTDDSDINGRISESLMSCKYFMLIDIADREITNVSLLINSREIVEKLKENKVNLVVLAYVGPVLVEIFEKRGIGVLMAYRREIKSILREQFHVKLE